MSGPLTPLGAGTEEAMGLARARDLEAQHHARHLRDREQVDRGPGRPWGRLILIGLGLFVLTGWVLTITTAIAGRS